MGFLKEERETHIFTDDTMDCYIIESRQRTVINKLRKLEETKYVELLDKIEETNEETGDKVVIQVKYKVAKGVIKIGKPREYTEEQKNKMRENFIKNIRRN